VRFSPRLPGQCECDLRSSIQPTPSGYWRRRWPGRLFLHGTPASRAALRAPASRFQPLTPAPAGDAAPGAIDGSVCPCWRLSLPECSHEDRWAWFGFLGYDRSARCRTSA
jgi:hypothetical protein